MNRPDTGPQRPRHPSPADRFAPALLGCSCLVGGRCRGDVTGLRRAAAVRGYRRRYDHTRRPAAWYPAELAASAEMIARGSFDLRDLVHGGHDAIRLAADAAWDDVDVTRQAALGGTHVLQLHFGDGRGRRGPR